MRAFKEFEKSLLDFAGRIKLFSASDCVLKFELCFGLVSASDLFVLEDLCCDSLHVALKGALEGVAHILQGILHLHDKGGSEHLALQTDARRPLVSIIAVHLDDMLLHNINLLHEDSIRCTRHGLFDLICKIL